MFRLSMSMLKRFAHLNFNVNVSILEIVRYCYEVLRITPLGLTLMTPVVCTYTIQYDARLN